MDAGSLGLEWLQVSLGKGTFYPPRAKLAPLGEWALGGYGWCVALGAWALAVMDHQG